MQPDDGGGGFVVISVSSCRKPVRYWSIFAWSAALPRARMAATSVATLSRTLLRYSACLAAAAAFPEFVVVIDVPNSRLNALRGTSSNGSDVVEFVQEMTFLYAGENPLSALGVSCRMRVVSSIDGSRVNCLR